MIKGLVLLATFVMAFAIGTVPAQAITDGVTVADLDWDIRHKFIAVEPAPKEPTVQ